ncbi:MAG: thioredoxin family protein [Chloroflexi bacterium]|nr:thioredoxin family protein [Chloroflexota bacterium]
MKVRMEVFSGDPPCPGCVAVLALADEFAKKYKGKLEVIKLVGEEAMTKFEEYKLGCVPAVVINEKIRIEGICPSRTTLDNALREGGLWTRLW